MRENFPLSYNLNQMEEIQQHIKKAFQTEDSEGFVFHEIKSKYVHTDVFMINTTENNRIFASFGMGAREMNCPREGYERAELVMFASGKVDCETDENYKIGNIVINMTKYPFLNDTWFGTGHTVDAHPRYKEQYGYDAFALLEMVEPANISDLGTVHFLTMIPIYNDERLWIMENSTFDYLEMLFEQFGDSVLYCDVPREHFIPDQDQVDEMQKQQIMEALGIDGDTYDALNEYLLSLEEQGIQTTYEMIRQWLEENA